MDAPVQRNRRILVVDDNRAIHEDIRKSLSVIAASRPETDEMEALLFGNGEREAPQTPSIHFEITSAYQSDEGIACVRRAVEEGTPFALAFMDVRIPPGRDGVETLAQIWEEDPALQAVICSAYSDYSWSAIVARLPRFDSFLILKKPFDSIEIRQMAYALTEKWNAHADIVHAYSILQKSEAKKRALVEAIRAQTEELAQLSMPFIPIHERVAVMPLIGDMNETRIGQVRETLVQRLQDRTTSIVIMDLTGIGTINSAGITELMRTVQAARLLGAELILTGMRATMARRLVELGADFHGVAIRQTLKDGIDLGMRRR